MKHYAGRTAFKSGVAQLQVCESDHRTVTVERVLWCWRLTGDATTLPRYTQIYKNSKSSFKY